MLIVPVSHAGSRTFTARAIDMPMSPDVDRPLRSQVTTTREMRSGISLATTKRFSLLEAQETDKIKGLLMYHKSAFEADLITHRDDNVSKPVCVCIVPSLLTELYLITVL